MAKRGRRQAPGLRYHAPTGQWYRKYDGQRKYFGCDESEAYDRWRAFENQRGGQLIQPELAARAESISQMFDLLARKRSAELLIDADPSQADEINTTLAASVARDFPTAPAPVITPARAEVITVKQVVDVYLADLKQNAKPQHYLDAKRRLKDWQKHAGATTDIQSLTPEVFRSYRASLYKQYQLYSAWESKQPRPIPHSAKIKAPGIAGSSFNKLMVLVVGAFNRAALRKGWQLPDHARCLAQLEQVSASKSEAILFDADSVKQILDSFDVKWKAIFTLALNIAGSNTDLAEIQWHHIRFDAGVIDYTRGKNNHLRRFPLWSQTRKALEEWKAICPSATYIFTTTHGNPFISATGSNRKDSLGQQFGNRMKALGLRQSFGAIRKTVATLATQCGATDIVCKMILGDAPNEVWRSYAQSLPETIRDVMARVGARLGIEV